MFWFHIFILFTVQIWKLSLFDSFLEHEYSNAGAAEGLNSYLSRQYPDICKIENNKELTGTSRLSYVIISYYDDIITNTAF